MNQPKSASRLFSFKEAAEFLGVSQNTVRSYVKAGQLDGTQVGSRTRITLQQLAHFYVLRHYGLDLRGEGAESSTALLRKALAQVEVTALQLFSVLNGLDQQLRSLEAVPEPDSDDPLPASPPRPLTAFQAAYYLGVHERTLSRLVKEGAVRRVPSGGGTVRPRMGYLKEDLDQYLASCYVPATASAGKP